MTNLIATIIVSIAAAITSGLETNRVEAELKPQYVIIGIEGYYPSVPKKKTVTTKVEMVKRLQFEWEGSARVVEKRETVRETVQIFVAKEGWEKEGVEKEVTPDSWNITPHTQSFGTITNSTLNWAITNTYWLAITNK